MKRRATFLAAALSVALALAALGGGWLIPDGAAHAAGLEVVERTDGSMTVKWEVPTSEVTCGFVVKWSYGSTAVGQWEKYTYSNQYQLTIENLEPKSAKLYTVKVYAMSKTHGGTDKLLYTHIEKLPQGRGEPGRAEPPAEDDTEPAADPLTANFVKKPSAHKEKRFSVRIRFSDPVEATGSGIIAALNVENGKATKARKYRGRAAWWNVTIKPTSDDAVTIRLSSSQDCSDSNAICAADGRALSREVAVTVSGP